MAAAQNERIENTIYRYCTKRTYVKLDGVETKGGIQLVSWNENSEN